MTLYLIIAFFSYATHYSNAPCTLYCSLGYLLMSVLANILDGYPGDPIFVLVNFSYAVVSMFPLFWSLSLFDCEVVAFSYPVLGFPARVALDDLLFRKSQDEEPPVWRLIVTAIILGVISYSLAVLLPQITIVFAYTGATAGYSSLLTAHLLHQPLTALPLGPILPRSLH